MDIKDMLTDEFVKGHKIDGEFIKLTILKMKEEIDELKETIYKKEGLKRTISELFDVYQAAYSNLLVLEIVSPLAMEKVKMEWMEKQKKRIKEYNGTMKSHKEKEKMAKGIFIIDGKKVELTEEQAKLMKSIAKGGNE